ncbi:uncharacterized protein LOC122254379 [Penaeus japonicus]|uniref:uncharacterized protein LOC122254379 n=1 Tax=Penaeus japonicus TaxID=27405 RepID=UPI001C70E374|nr:uncharacterized protein LOC122254379 [Penaeus japonicus]
MSSDSPPLALQILILLNMASVSVLVYGVGVAVRSGATLGGLMLFLYIAIILYILYNSSLLPPIICTSFGHPLFRSSKERRRARLKDARSSKCNSGDSGDSGIELVTGPGPATTVDMTSHGPDVDSNNYVDPAFVVSPRLPHVCVYSIVGEGRSRLGNVCVCFFVS